MSSTHLALLAPLSLALEAAEVQVNVRLACQVERVTEVPVAGLTRRALGEAQGVAVPGAADSSERALLLRGIRGAVPHT